MGFIQPIRIDGLKDAQSALRAIDDGLGKVLRQTLNVGSALVVKETLPWMPRRTGRAQASVRASSTQNKARVTEGSNKAPYVPWLDFGGRRPGDSAPRKNWGHAGRYVWRTLGVHNDEIMEELSTALVALVRSVGLEVVENG